VTALVGWFAGSSNSTITVPEREEVVVELTSDGTGVRMIEEGYPLATSVVTVVVPVTYPVAAAVMTVWPGVGVVSK
jgi:hypothetical protein